jgi:hypothetical protein
VETEKACDYEAEENREQPRSCDKVCKSHIYHFLSKDGYENGVSCDRDKQRCNTGVKEHVKEELVVEKPNAVVDPRAMVVHLEHASVTLRTVMSSIGLCSQTSLTHSYASVVLSFERHRLISRL